MWDTLWVTSEEACAQRPGHVRSEGEVMRREKRYCIWIKKSLHARGNAEDSTRRSIKAVQLNACVKDLLQDR